MRPLGILTDASAYFPQPRFDGRETVTILPLGTRDNTVLRARFATVLAHMLTTYSHVLIIFHGRAISPLAQIAQDYVERNRLNARVIVTDSRTFSLGLGLLVQHAAGKVISSPHPDIRDLALHIRRHAEEMYTLLSIPNFDYLAAQNMLDPSQKVIARILNFVPVFSMERNRLTLHEKIRSPRQIFNLFQDFLLEFAQIDSLGYFSPETISPAQTRSFRLFLKQHFPQAKIHPLAAPLSLQQDFGAGASGLIVVERRLT